MTKTETILQLVHDGQLTVEQANIMLGEVDKTFHMKLHPSGVISVYGIARWPLNAFSEGWHRLIEHGTDIETFIAGHRREIEEGQKKKWKKQSSTPLVELSS